ncbi:MAG: hypothetical protein NWE92_05160 [Candidatus Bathyarchaeota archaeon]|nr:hypothetical protein [Candidatus Bathyarchaeota archaeon]
MGIESQPVVGIVNSAFFYAAIPSFFRILFTYKKRNNIATNSCKQLNLKANQHITTNAPLEIKNKCNERDL